MDFFVSNEPFLGCTMLNVSLWTGKTVDYVIDTSRYSSLAVSRNISLDIQQVDSLASRDVRSDMNDLLQAAL